MSPPQKPVSCQPATPAAAMLTAEDKKLIVQVWEKVAGHQEEFGSEALQRCGLGPGGTHGVGSREQEPCSGCGLGPRAPRGAG